jgi:hypothetical protein
LRGLAYHGDGFSLRAGRQREVRDRLAADRQRDPSADNRLEAGCGSPNFVIAD